MDIETIIFVVEGCVTAITPPPFDRSKSNKRIERRVVLRRFVDLNFNEKNMDCNWGRLEEKSY